MDISKLSRIQDNWVERIKKVLSNEDSPSERKSLTQAEMA